MDKQSIGLWLMAGILVATFALFHFQQLAEPLIFAGGRMSESFVVGACPAPKDNVIYGWGNRAVGQKGTMEVGCFNAAAGKIVGVSSLEDCQSVVCR